MDWYNFSPNFVKITHNYWVKIVAFLIKAYFLSECQFPCAKMLKFYILEKLKILSFFKLHEKKNASERGTHNLKNFIMYNLKKLKILSFSKI